MTGAQLDVAPEVVELRGGRALAPDGRALSLAVIAAAIQRGELPLDQGETTLEASATVDPTAETFSYGAHVAVADVDPLTGAVELVRYAAVNDCGRLINPAIVEGQIEGGIVQGIGGALMEQITYTPDGLPSAETLFDYLVPTACDVPPLAIELFETPSAVTSTGARGAGEIGIIGTGPAVAGAISAAFGGQAQARQLPLTPPRVRAMAKAASTGREAMLSSRGAAYCGDLHEQLEQEPP
jgi:CO/xanthine dehydrogenase Mo-binding subunit